MKRIPIAATVATALLSLAMLAASTMPANAAAVRFAVMNTSESPPDGVWFRNSPTSADTNRETGFGIYAGEVIDVDCWVRGEAVGRFGNTIWYQALNASRPTVNGHSNYGYVNTHYVDDGMTANNPHPSVPSCTLQPAPPPPPPVPPTRNDHGTVFYKTPYDLSRNAPAPAINLDSSAWQGCNGANAVQGTPAADSTGAPVTTLSGWSLGRLGPIYYMTGPRASLSRVSYVLMIDPVNDKDFGECDRQGGQRIARWPNINRQAQLVVLLGNRTGDSGHHAIQAYWFNDVRNAERTLGVNLTDRILVCNYQGEHRAMMDQGKKYITRSALTSCPRDLSGIKYQRSWRP